MTSQPENFPSIVSQAAVVMDMTTGTVVYAKNPLVEHYPASITKIMTAMLALQHGQLTDEIPVSQEAANQPPDKLYFVPGEQKPLEQMLYGLLLISANDAAVAIAQKYGGSVAGFANMMNSEAKALGATHTHFDNPNGLPDPNHVTTAYDMALIAQAAMQYPEFRKIVSTRSYSWHGQAWKSQLYNINHMLFNYPGCIGIKTGYTSVAHETIAVAATRGNTTFLAILMDAPTNYEIQNDATQLLNSAFAHYQTEVIAPKGQEVTEIKTQNGHEIPVYNPSEVVATVDKAHPLQPAMRVKLNTLPSGGSNQGGLLALRTGSTKGSMLSAGISSVPAQDSWLHVGDVSYSLANQPTVTIPVFARRSDFPRPAVTTGGFLSVGLKYWLWIVTPLGILIIAGAVVWGIRKRRRRNGYPSSFEFIRR